MFEPEKDAMRSNLCYYTCIPRNRVIYTDQLVLLGSEMWEVMMDWVCG
jgi:hypothetical protein